MKKFFLFAVLLLPSIAQAISFGVVNNTSDSFTILTSQADDKTLAPGGRYKYKIDDIGGSTIRHLQSQSPGSQTIETTVDEGGVSSIDIVDMDGSQLWTTLMSGSFGGDWFIEKDPETGDYILENIQSLIGRLESDLAKQAANDMVKHNDDGQFENKWYALGSEGYDHLLSLSDKDRQILRRIVTLLPAGSHVLPIQELFVTLENIQALIARLESDLAKQAANDMLKHNDDGQFENKWYAPGTEGYDNLLGLSANDRQLLLEIAKSLSPRSRKPQIIKLLTTLAPSVVFINNTPNSLYNLTQGGELAPGERYTAKVGKGTINHLKSPPPLNQVVQTTLSTRTSDGSFITTVAVVREDGTIVSSARVPGNAGKWSVQIDPYKGNYVVENSQSLISQLDSDLAKQAANDMLKHLYDGAFEGYWYAPGRTGYNNLKGVSRKDRQTLLEIATLLPTGSHGPQIRELIASIA